MKFKVGDTVLMCAEHHPDFGEVKIIEIVEDGIAWVDYHRKIGYHEKTGAGWLGRENEEPMIRHLSKLEKVLR